jgi:hypothetical protein
MRPPRGRRSKDLIHQQKMSAPSNSRGRRSTKNHTKKRIKQESDNREKKKLIMELIKENEELKDENDELSYVKDELSYVKDDLRDKEKELSKLKRTNKHTSKTLKEFKNTAIKHDYLKKELERLGGSDNEEVARSFDDLREGIECPYYGEKDKYDAGVNSSYEPPGPSYDMNGDFISHFSNGRRTGVNTVRIGRRAADFFDYIMMN